ncbi:TrpB-like pyridoxal phosphate-dependent enzyme [Hippea maritima]|uniref:Tryptophan synthase beta chain n=1 Tax=Hippea maritima (strain ATCC 700847 / DSM 10411 / MH2) TaxID=760142 RepID=F2LU05_HIPMA|nr:TrpB-like pyridoxal phosphate-dependent enzyme [Hippea maritima]AEA33404.1 Tryptophan synthase beta chain [Hippea maritima DSM 10411]
MERKILLKEDEMPRYWYNILPDMPTPVKPPINPKTMKPINPDDLKAIFPSEIIEQEMSSQREISIPQEVLDIYAIWRPTPLVRAYNLEKALGTPAKIYYKNESVSPAGSHKPNTAIAQAYYNKKEGITTLTTETGAGQWGSALALAGALLGLNVRVYMVKVSYEQKPFRRSMIHLWGAEVYPSPSDKTEAGRRALEENPDNPGSLGLAISEAVEDAATHDNTNYALGSVLNHVLLHQTVIGLEAQKQFEKIGDYPDVIFAPCGGGSNLGGVGLPFIRDKINGKDVRVVAVEPASCPTLTKGIFTYDYADVAMMTPLLYMYTLGHKFMPPSIHAGGLRYHGDSPILSQLRKDGLLDAVAYNQTEVFEAGALFAKTEGIVPAPETCHAIKGAVDEALKAKEEGKEKTILINFSGHGHFDMTSYDKFLSGEMKDYEYPEKEIKKALDYLPKV